MNFIRYAVILGAALVLPLSTFAAAIILSPDSVSPKVGQSFTVTITADPAGSKTYTTRTNLSFDPAQVAFVSFTFAPKWVALSQVGYDAEDNANGTLVKTAGYPGGITAPTVFGTATFRAKSAGSSAVRVTTSSLMYDALSKNQISGAQGSMQVVVAATALPPAPKPTTVAPAPTPMVAVAVESTTTETTSMATSTLEESAIAAVAASGSSTIPWWAWALGAIAVLGGGFWYWHRRATHTSIL